jgi:hypothetical protein
MANAEDIEIIPWPPMCTEGNISGKTFSQ